MKDFKQYFLVSAEPEIVYQGLTRPETIRLWTGEPAEMSTESGSEFSLWDGSIVGRNLEFVENSKLVQEWYFGEQEVPSIATIKLHPHKKGTSVEVIHTNIPDEDFESIRDGWIETYMASLIDFYTGD